MPLLIVAAGKSVHVEYSFLTSVYRNMTASIAIITALLAVIFVFFVYVGYGATSKINSDRGSQNNKKILIIKRLRLTLILATGAFSMLYLLFSMPGPSIGDRYFNLVLFRAQHESFFDDAKNFVTSNLFSLTQTFAISSTLLFFYFKERRAAKYLLVFAVVAMLFMATFAVSRRIMTIQFFVIYFAIVLMTGKWFFRRLLLIFPIALVWLAFGKDLMWQVPRYFSSEGSPIVLDFDEVLPRLLFGFSSLGITLNSSWASLIFLDDLPPRFGVDHILAALRFLPLGSLGVDEYQLYGPRIVRISTEAFSDVNALDIPPGLFGQMWLDFRLFGPIIWGLFFGWLIKQIQMAFDRFERTWTSCGVFSILLFVAALPLNSGSFDFNFSVDMFFLLLFLWFVVRVVRPRKNFATQGTWYESKSAS